VAEDPGEGRAGAFGPRGLVVARHGVPRFFEPRDQPVDVFQFGVAAQVGEVAAEDHDIRIQGVDLICDLCGVFFAIQLSKMGVCEENSSTAAYGFFSFNRVRSDGQQFRFDIPRIACDAGRGDQEEQEGAAYLFQHSLFSVLCNILSFIINLYGSEIRIVQFGGKRHILRQACQACAYLLLCGIVPKALR
jgi:hypothetical protein